MRLNVITLFPQMVSDALSYGVIGRAIKQGVIELVLFNPRDYAQNKHNTIDDKPFGGGAGMVMMHDPLFRTWQDIKNKGESGPLVFMSPQGQKVTQKLCNDWSELPALTLLCGRYEGIDQRFLDGYVDEEISLGDYVISGGELAACVLIDAVARQIKGVLGAEESAKTDSFMTSMLAPPQYTRSELLGQSGVPDVLLSGNHKAIAEWKSQQALTVTKQKRPDLIAGTSGD
ncbi:tRNA (guanosine(37)-N1)-methyltransferase TrmD [Marinicella rhabdoformis]|uniref:tRNA (guanosine(37)-N1)-methyltransferase TrmD n=1 Tax=Marinicella rhabdoformis TaxID=2580566 RepID=UPI001C551CF3|nr:tRNA (guanosine(37)-N1)-methyltransferase TrmD [Marinicella rhabdoformis]